MMADLSNSVEANAEAAARDDARLPVATCLNYGFGTIATAILLNSVSTYFPTFMSTVLGQSPALAGILLTLSKLYDAVIDVVIGLRSDRRTSRLGRRSYLLIGAIVGSVAFFLLFSPLAGSGSVLAIGLLLILYSTGYSLFNVPYVAMAPDIARGYDNRTQLMAYRTFFSSVGQFAALAGAAALIQFGGGGVNGYAVMGGGLALVILVSEGATFFGTRHIKERAVAPQARVPLGEAFRSLLQNKPGVLLMAAKFLQYVSLACNVSTGLLFKLNVLQIGYAGQVQLSTFQNVAMALSMPAWLWAGKRWGKKTCYMGATLFYALALLTWLFTTKGIGFPALLWRGVALGIGAGGMILMSLSMLPDVMQHDFRRTGLRREGVYSSIYSVNEKLGFAVGPAVMGIYLSMAGYVSTTKGQLATQGPAAIRALYVGFAIIPALLLLASVAIMLFYDLDRRRVLLSAADPGQEIGG